MKLLSIGALMALTLLALGDWKLADATQCTCYLKSCLMINSTSEWMKKSTANCTVEKQGITFLRIVEVVYNNLPADTFRSFPNLTDLDISKGTVSNIEPGVFENVPNLKKINIRNNTVNTLKDNTFRGLDALEFLFIISSKLTTIGPNALNGLKNLTHLFLTDNQLTQLPENLFAPTPALKVINLAGNRISNVLPAGIFNNIRGLSLLDLSHNQLTAFEFPSLKAEHVLLHNNSLTSLHLNDHFTLVLAEHNRIYKLSGTGANLHILHLSENNLTDITPIWQMNNLTKLTLTNNPLQPNSSFNLTHLEQLLLSHTNITITNETFANMAELKLLDLSYNNLTELDFSMFSGLSKLETLIVAFNNIDKIHFEHREYLPKLRVLEICGNGWNSTFLSHVLEYLKLYKLKSEMQGFSRAPFSKDLCANGDEPPKLRDEDNDSDIESLLNELFPETQATTTDLPKPSAKPSVPLAIDTMAPVVAPSSAANEQSAEVGSSPLYITFQVMVYTFAVFGVVALGVVAYYIRQRGLTVRQIVSYHESETIHLVEETRFNQK